MSACRRCAGPGWWMGASSRDGPFHTGTADIKSGVQTNTCIMHRGTCMPPHTSVPGVGGGGGGAGTTHGPPP